MNMRREKGGTIGNSQTFNLPSSVVTAASAFAAAAVPPVVEPPVAQHKGALKTKQNRLVKNITLGFRVPILGNGDSKQYYEAKLMCLFAREPRQTISGRAKHAIITAASHVNYLVAYSVSS